MADEKLSELEAQMLGLESQKFMIESQIRARKREVAKENKQVVDSIEQLICNEHPGSVFKAVRKIEGSFIYSIGLSKDGTVTSSKDLYMYQCGSCKGDGKNLDSKAYDCPSCGIVTGEYVKVPYNSPEEDWTSLAGREGEHYHCRICNNQIGYLYWKFS